jgi:hypothetical protein
LAICWKVGYGRITAIQRQSETTLSNAIDSRFFYVNDDAVWQGLETEHKKRTRKNEKRKNEKTKGECLTKFLYQNITKKLQIDAINLDAFNTII